MATFSLKKSYQLKDLKEINFKDLWGEHGIFTTMWIFGKPVKILFLENHIKNLMNSLKVYGIQRKFLKKDILKIIDKNLSKKKNYNHLLRIALTKKFISISLRKRVPPKLDFNLKLVNFKRERPRYKNLKYKKILSHLSKMNNSKTDIALVHNKKILETGTSNLFFIKDKKVFTPKKDYYVGNTYKFFKTKIKKIIKKDIFIKDLKEYDEIILIGSGKGVASVKTIKELNWVRKKLERFKIFLKYYRLAEKNSNYYKFLK
tara:strand:- start:379 stop:1158 length:780 start_codon:yes stop_codon:yes gene_type:complete